MKKFLALRLRGLVRQACKEKGVEPTRRMHRSIKKLFLRSNGQVRSELRG